MTRPHLTIVPPVKPPGRYPNPPVGRHSSTRETADAARAAVAVRAWYDHNLPWWFRRALKLEK